MLHSWHLILITLCVSSAYADSAIPAFTIDEAKTKCGTAEIFVSEKNYSEGLKVAREVLNEYPKSPRAANIYRSCIARTPDQEASGYIEAAQNCYSMLASLYQTQKTLAAELGDTMESTDKGFEERAARLNDLSDQIEETLETDYTENTTKQLSNGKIVKGTRRYDSAKRRQVEEQTRVYNYAAAEVSQFVQSNIRKGEAIAARLKETRGEARQLENQIAVMYVLAIKSLLKSENYAVAYSVSKSADEFGLKSYAISNDLGAICSAENLFADTVPDIIRRLESFMRVTARSNNYNISLNTCRLDLLAGYLESHAEDVGGRDLSNFNFSERDKQNLRFKLRKSGELLHVGSGRLNNVVVANMDGTLYKGSWKKLTIEENRAKCQLPADNLCVFYQEGARLYFERLKTEE